MTDVGVTHLVAEAGIAVPPTPTDRLRARLLTPLGLRSLPRLSYLVDGILPSDSLSVLYGRPGSAKSFLAIDWAHCVATGDWWFGREVARGSVLYVVGEGAGGLNQRAEAWEKARGFVVDEEHMRWLPVAVNFLQPATAAALVEVVDELQPVFVVVDTLARCLVGGDENSARDVGIAVDVADQLRRASGAAVLLVHHSGVDGARVRGSSALEGAADVIIEAKADGPSVRLRCIKAKDAAPFDDLHLTLRATGDSAAIYCQDSVAVVDELARSETDLLDVVLAVAGSDGMSASVLFKATEMPERTFYRALKSLVIKGLVVNVGTPKQPRYTAASEASR